MVRSVHYTLHGAMTAGIYTYYFSGSSPICRFKIRDRRIIPRSLILIIFRFAINPTNFMTIQSLGMVAAVVKKLGFVSYDHPGRGNASRRKMSINTSRGQVESKVERDVKTL